MTKLSTVIEEWLDDILRMTFHSGQSGIRSLVFNIAEQMMWDLLLQNEVWETLNAHISKVSLHPCSRWVVVQEIPSLQLGPGPYCDFFGLKQIQQWKKGSTIHLLRRKIQSIQYRCRTMTVNPHRAILTTGMTKCPVGSHSDVSQSIVIASGKQEGKTTLLLL